METKEIAVRKSPAEISMELLKSGLKAEDLQGILAVQKDFEANEAMKAYNLDMVEVHRKIESVAKTKRNDQTKSRYAELDEIIKSAKPIYTEGGFSVSFSEGIGAPAENVRVACEVVHRLGHKQSYFYDVPLDGVGIKGNANMTKIHAKASSVSYGRRYLMCMIFNIPTSDDNDGNNSNIETLDEKQLVTVNDYLRSLSDKKKIDVKKFLSVFKVEKVEQLPKARYEEIINLFKTREAAKD